MPQVRAQRHDQKDNAKPAILTVPYSQTHSLRIDLGSHFTQ